MPFLAVVLFGSILWEQSRLAIPFMATMFNFMTRRSISSFDVRGAALPGAFLFVLLYMFVAVVLSIELTSGV